MKCDETRELLSLYIDQMLDDSLRKAVEEHLFTCNLCKKEYDDIKEMVNLLNQVETVPVPMSFEARWKRALQQEKANPSDAEAFGKPPGRKNKLRKLMSIAAVFAVGVISFGLYQDVIGDLPSKPGGASQSSLEQQSETDTLDAKMKEIENNIKETEDQDLYYGTVNDMSAADAENGSNSMRNNADGQGDKPVTLNNKRSVSSDGDAGGVMPSADSVEPKMSMYGLADSPESDSGSDTVTAEGYGGEPVSGAGADGSAGDSSKKIKQEFAWEDCNRSLTSSGVERNVAAVQYYNGLIEEKLEDFEYQILDSSFVQTGEWKFRVFIFRGKDGYTYNEEIFVIGKDGEIEVIYTNEFMGL